MGQSQTNEGAEFEGFTTLQVLGNSSTDPKQGHTTMNVQTQNPPAQRRHTGRNVDMPVKRQWRLYGNSVTLESKNRFERTADKFCYIRLSHCISLTIKIALIYK